MQQGSLQQNNVRPHMNARMIAEIHCLDSTVLDYPPYSSDFAPSHFCIFIKLKHLRGHHVLSDSEVTTVKSQQWWRWGSSSKTHRSIVMDSWACLNVGRSVWTPGWLCWEIIVSNYRIKLNKFVSVKYLFPLHEKKAALLFSTSLQYLVFSHGIMQDIKFPWWSIYRRVSSCFLLGSDLV
jgi:hypothetical protein